MSLLDPMDDADLDAMIAALEAERLSQIKALQEEIARMRLTEEEREAITVAAANLLQCYGPRARVLLRLLERTK